MTRRHFNPPLAEVGRPMGGRPGPLTPFVIERLVMQLELMHIFLLLKKKGSETRKRELATNSVRGKYM